MKKPTFLRVCHGLEIAYLEKENVGVDLVDSRYGDCTAVLLLGKDFSVSALTSSGSTAVFTNRNS